jgi:hypothetical protein
MSRKTICNLPRRPHNQEQCMLPAGHTGPHSFKPVKRPRKKR